MNADWRLTRRKRKQEINSLIHQGFIFLMKWIKEEKEREEDVQESLTKVSSWRILVSLSLSRIKSLY